MLRSDSDSLASSNLRNRVSDLLGQHLVATRVDPSGQRQRQQGANPSLPRSHRHRADRIAPALLSEHRPASPSSGRRRAAACSVHSPALTSRRPMLRTATWHNCVSGRPVPASAVKCRCHRLRVLCRNSQQRQGRSVRGSAALLPITKRRDAHPDHERELALRDPELRTHRLDVSGFEHGGARWPKRPAPNPARLANAREQFLKRPVLHLNSSRTNRPRTSVCAAVRSPCSFFR